MTAGPLARFTVLDLTRVRAGPTAVRYLADWGANCIKVEMPPGAGDADMGGPEILSFDAMAAAYLRIRGWTTTIRSAALSGDLYDVFRSGVNLTPNHARSAVTWGAWLQRHYSSDAMG
jgi:hypothetical protein